ncbi:GLPGLI family protein [Flavobacterium humi]|uniref:GLPGLI family protein n=1 Tax=Flavobacterium humi TaxID=2562683 RepID=A0A4Z0L8C7_9FLAO|nr:GLPGLI family protein [Flavobacterium humi]TGD57390.1 GLPGLI family protein [Flavobacterium humi]
MKKIITALSLIIASSLSHAQDFQGMAVYESKTSTADFKSRIAENKDITPEMRKTIEERMKKAFEKTFILNFDKNASIYKEEERLDAPGSQNNGMRMMGSFMGGGGTHYKNIKDKTFTIDKEMMGKEFLIHDSLPKLDWKLGQETKEIGGYMCFKATAMQKASKTDFRNFRMKKRDEEKDKKEAAAEKNKPTNFMNEGEMPKEVEVVAWYTPEIPVSQGPEGYYGLPGLILEVSAGKTIILCSKVVMNVKDKKEIKAPTNGKPVTQKEFDEIVTKKMEEMQQMYQSRGGNGGGMHIRMGN